MQQGASYTSQSLKTVCLGLLFLLTPTGVPAQIAAGECKFLGNIISASIPPDFGEHWNQVTPENAGKWGSVEANRDVMNWTALDNAYNFAREHNLPFRQHTLVWGQQQPSWISSLTQSEQKEEVEEWISAFCERYPDTDFIDVVNEPLHAQPNYKEALGGNGLTGWDWVVWTFETTRKYCPDAKLFLNDYNIISNEGATTSYLKIIQILSDAELIDGIGEQGHFLETANLATLTDNLSRLGETGVPIHITEFEINNDNDSEQASLYESIFPRLWTHTAVEGITLWGYRQGQIWREDAYLLRTDGSARPAFDWLQNYVGGAAESVSCTPVAINESIEEVFSVHPNPATGESISVSLPRKVFELQVTDMTGRLMMKMMTDASGHHVLDLKLPRGPYLLSLKSELLRTKMLIVL